MKKWRPVGYSILNHDFEGIIYIHVYIPIYVCVAIGDLQKLGAWVAQWVRSLDLTTHTSLSPIQRGFAPGFVNYNKGCTRLTVASDKVYQLLAHGRWYSGFLHHWNWSPWYSWNIVESGVKTPKIIKKSSKKFSHFISNISHSKVSRWPPPQDPPYEKMKKIFISETRNLIQPLNVGEHLVRNCYL